MTRSVRVALGQMTSKLGDVNYNVEKAEDFINQAGHERADIICLPELFATGYNLMLLGKRMVELSHDYYDFLITQLAAAARASNIYVIAPIAIPLASGLYNGAVIFDRTGRQMGNYYKTHAFSLEKQYFCRGDSYPTFSTDFGKIGILICYDVGFPEAARNLCLQGAEMIFVPAAWRKQDEQAWVLNLPSRALENQLFTVGVNRSGYEGDLHLFGRSMVCSPIGEVCLQADYDTDEVITYDINLDDVREARSKVEYLKDRRPEIYCLQAKKD